MRARVALVPDEVRHTVATVDTYDRIADRLVDRYGARVDRIEFSTPVTGPADAAVLSRLLDRLRR